MPATFDLTGDNRIKAGAVYAFSLSNTDSNGTTLFTALSAQIRRTASSSDILATFSTQLQSGVWIIWLPSSVTATLPATPADGGWVYDAFGTTSDGLSVCALEGSVQVDPAVTR